MLLIEQFLQEKKDHIINKLPTLNDKQKATVNDFFTKYPNYEKEVDWNKKQDLTYDFFKSIMAKQKGSRSSVKQAIKQDASLQFKSKLKPDEYKVLYKDHRYILVSPLSHRAAVFMNSFDCFGTGAKWCIGSSEEPCHWLKYVFDGSSFVMAYDNVQKDKRMFQYTDYPDGNCIVWHQDDTVVSDGDLALCINEYFSPRDDDIRTAELEKQWFKLIEDTNPTDGLYKKVYARETKMVIDEISSTMVWWSDDETFEGYDIDEMFDVVIQQEESTYSFFHGCDNEEYMDTLKTKIIKKARKDLKQKFYDWQQDRHSVPDEDED